MLLSLILLFGLSSSVWAAGGNLVQGGQGVGPVRLGQNLNQVQAVLGAPDKVQASPNDPNSKLMYYKKHGLAVFLGSNGGVIGVTVMGGNWQTPDGIKIGSDAASVVKIYGQGLQRGQGNVNYASRGLAFSLKQGRVSSIYVFKREEDRPLLGDRLIIPGQRVGSIKIGMPASSVANAWGNADNITAMGSSGRSLYRYKEEALGLIVNSNGIIEGMVMETGDFITKEGVKVGSSKDEVFKVFGQTNPANGSLIYEKQGIGFRLTQGRVSQITVLPKQ
ncbi:MAG: hypothetical protein K6A35_02940 [bacterium]|nr:hypothetical protein [bacterium]